MLIHIITKIAIDQLTYTTLSYANGPGSTLNLNTDRSRKDLAGKTFGMYEV